MLRSPPAWRLPGLLHHEPRFHSSTEFLDSRQSQHRAASAPCSYHRASRRKSVIGSRMEDAASAVPVSTKRRDTGDTTMGLDPALREHYKSPAAAGKKSISSVITAPGERHQLAHARYGRRRLPLA